MTYAALAPLERLSGESSISFGKRRKAIVRDLYRSQWDTAEIAHILGVSHRYVLEALGIGVGRYEWRPPSSVLRGPFPTREEALAEEPLISENPLRMTPEQAIQRATQMYRWLMAGLTMDEIGKRHGIGRERVSKILQRFGFPTVWAPAWRTGHPRPLPPIEHEDDVWRRVAGS